MGFEYMWNPRRAGDRMGWSKEWGSSDRNRGRDGAMQRSPDDSEGWLFGGETQLLWARRSARGLCQRKHLKRNTSLRAIKDAESVRWLPQDLLGG